MFPKKNKLTRSDFVDGFFSGNKKNTPLFTFFQINNNKPTLQLGFVISKKISKKAVFRNTLKRKLYSYINKSSIKNLPLKILVIVKPEISKTPDQHINKSLNDYFSQTTKVNQ